jgi:hypothetical protein
MAFSKAKRDQYAYEIRKSKNEEYVRAKRMKFLNNAKNNSEQNVLDLNFESEGMKLSYEELNVQFINAINSGDPGIITEAVRHIREKISTKTLQNLKDFYETKLVHPIVKLLDPKYKEFIELQKESLWVVANTFSGDYENYKEIVDDKLIDQLYGFILNSNDSNIIETVSCISNK